MHLQQSRLAVAKQITRLDLCLLWQVFSSLYTLP